MDTISDRYCNRCYYGHPPGGGSFRLDEAALALHLIGRLGKQRDRPEGERERTFEALNIKYKIHILPKPWIL